jgi:hypothetical protein
MAPKLHIEPGRKIYHQDELYDALDQDNSLELFQQMLDYGMDPTMKLLLSKDADPNEFAGIESKPALWFVAEETDSEMINLLVAHGAKVSGSFALQQAAAVLSPEKVQMPFGSWC